jgi:hypothetical protein
MQVRLESMHVDMQVVGARKVVLDGRRHIGAIIDEEEDSYVVGPLIHDRSDSVPVSVAVYAVGAHRGAIPILDSLEDEFFEGWHRYLGALADKLGLQVRRG